MSNGVLYAILRRLKRIDNYGIRALRRSILLEVLLVVILLFSIMSISGLSILSVHFAQRAGYWKTMSAVIYRNWKEDIIEQDLLFDEQILKYEGRKDNGGIRSDGKYRNKKSGKSSSPSHKTAAGR